MKPVLQHDFKKEIVDIRYLADGNLGIIHLPNVFRVLSSNNLYRSHTGIVMKSEQIRSGSKCVAISHDSQLLAIGNNEDKVINIASFETKIITQKLKRHNGAVESLAFDPKGRYLISGGTDGKVYLWDIADGEVLSRLPSHADYVSEIAISNDGIFAITGGYDGSIWINNLNTETRPKKLKVSDKKISKIVFSKDGIAIVGSEIGDIAVVDYLKSKVIKRLKYSESGINGFVTAMNGRYLFVSGESLKVPVFDIQSGEEISPHMIVVGDNISCMTYSEELSHLAISTQDGRLYVYNLADDDDLKEQIDKRDFKRAYKMAIESPILKKSQEYLRLESEWEVASQEATKLLMEDRNEKAVETLEPFKGIPQKAGMIADLLKDYREYKNLVMLVEQKKYARAYSIVENCQSLMDTQVYKDLEKSWDEAFAKAKQAILKHHRIDTAQSLLKDFYTVSSKTPLIQTILRNSLLYIQFQDSIKNRDFKTFFSLVAQNKFLAKTKEYEEVLKLGDRLFEVAKQKIVEKDFDGVESLTKTIKYFKGYQEEAAEIEELTKAARHFFHFYNAQNSVVCFKIIDKYPIILKYQEAEQLEIEWQKVTRFAEKAALRGDTAAIKEIFADYKECEERYGKLTSLIKTSYQNQIKSSLKGDKGAEEFKKAILLYITLFGYDEDIDDTISMVNAKFGNVNIVFGENEKEEREINSLVKNLKESLPDRII